MIQHVRPVDLQASMVQGAEILVRWVEVLSKEPLAGEIDFSVEMAWWQNIASEFTVKTRLMWQDGWFRDYDALTKEWSTQQDTMHLAPVFCGAAGWGHKEQLRPYFAQPPMHSSGWASLSWPPVVMALVGSASVADLSVEAAELSYRFIDASYRSIDSRQPDQHGGLPGVTREYRQTVSVGKWGAIEYVNAGIEGYGWGALSIHLLIRYLLGLQEEEINQMTIAPLLPQALRRVGATYGVESVAWGKYRIAIECVVLDAESYTVRLRCGQPKQEVPDGMVEGEPVQYSYIVQACEWKAKWGEKRTLLLPDLTMAAKK